MVVSPFQLSLIDVPVFKSGGLIQSANTLRKHICNKNIRCSVIVYIGHIRTHRCKRRVAHVFFELFAKRSVLIVDVEVVFLKEVVGDVDIIPSIAINIADGGT